MSKINITPDEFGDIVVCFILAKIINPDSIIPLNKEFNEYAEKLIGKGMKPQSLNYYLSLDSRLRVYFKRIKDVFEYNQNQSAVIQIWPHKTDKEQLDKENKKDGIIKRIIKKLLNKESINKEEENLLLEVIGDENQKLEE